MRISDWSSDVCSSDLAGLELKVVALDLDRTTGDFTTGPAMSEADCLAALSIGAAALANDELDLLVLGEMGIGNSTAASALCARSFGGTAAERSEEHTSELQSLMRISYAVFCLKKKKYINTLSKQHRHSENCTSHQ